ncbi:MAG: SPFH domain-containing protein, partial [Pseudomonadota bacterium]
MRFLPILVLLIGAGVAVGLSSVYIVDERQQALLLEFGRVKKIVNAVEEGRLSAEAKQALEEQGVELVQGPGLYFKLPAPMNTVATYEKRILALETRDLEVTPLDNRRLVVNAFARWRIVDPLRFREAAQTQERGESLLEEILTQDLREVLGKVNSDNILSADRASLMRETRDNSLVRARTLGVEIVDVRIRRADLPEQ